MGLFIGGNEPSKIYIGSNEVSRVYVGSNLVWEAGGGSFSPSDLSPQGWFSAMSLSSLWLDTSASSAVTGPDQLVARADNITGNGLNATQATSGSRPTFSRVPVGGVRNLLVRTEEFDNAEWGKNNLSVSANVATAPDGLSTADSLTGTATTSEHFVRDFAVADGVSSQTISVYAKANGYNFFVIRSAISPSSYGNASFNLSTGAVNGSPPIGSASISDAGGGWYRCSWTFVRGTVGGGPILFLPSASGGHLETHNGTDGILLWGAQLENGSLTNYQRVGSIRDVTEASVGSVQYLFDDGGDSLNWEAPAGTYTIARVDSAGTVTIQTGVSLSGSTDILLDAQTVEYVAVDRALTGGETSDLTAYLEAVANPAP